MVPFVLASSWVVRHWGQLRARTFLVIAMGCYFGWLASFDVYYSLVDDARPTYYWNVARELVGLPTFFFGCVFLAGVVRSSTPEAAGVVH
jgi:hypothetical protein